MAKATSGYELVFNQDFTSICVLGGNDGFRIFSINSCDNIEEIFTYNHEKIIIIDRLFNSELVAMVTAQGPRYLQFMDFKSKQKTCCCSYPTAILSIHMNRSHMMVCLMDTIFIHDIKDMDRWDCITDIAPNIFGLCALSLNSYLAYPNSSTYGDLRLCKATDLRSGTTILAHKSRLSALNFSPSGQLLATASERGTVIRLFCVNTGRRLQEFRRGVKRCVRIASLVFSTNAQFLCVTSNTETVHIFKIDEKAVGTAQGADALKVSNTGAADKQQEKSAPTSANASGLDVSLSTDSSGWSAYLSNAMSSYLLPTQVSDVLSQDRAFATAVLTQPGKRHICGLAYVQKDLKVLIASEEGFLYIHEFDEKHGGVCKLQAVHDLRCALDGVVELSLSEHSDKMSPGSSNKEDKHNADVPTENDCSYGNAAIQIDCTSKTRQPTTSTNANQNAKCKKSTVARCIIQNPAPMPDNSYASILKGHKKPDPLTDSAKYRKICDAIDTPNKLFDERQFPPMPIAARD